VVIGLNYYDSNQVLAVALESQEIWAVELICFGPNKVSAVVLNYIQNQATVTNYYGLG
jgi:hypothetical protein